MDETEAAQHERETREWLKDLENFGRPPPPRHMQRTTDWNRSEPGVEETNGMDQFMMNDEFRDKVRQFQISGSHPYASKTRVETSKKIAVQGGTHGTASSLKSSTSPKERISKAEIDQITSNVRRVNRPLNPWAEPNQNHHNSMPLANGDSSSAYSSYSSVGGANSPHVMTSPHVNQMPSPQVFSASKAVKSPHSNDMMDKTPHKESSPLGLSRDTDFRRAMDEFAHSAALLARSQSPTPAPENYQFVVPHNDMKSPHLSTRSTPCRPVYLPYDHRGDDRSAPPIGVNTPVTVSIESDSLARLAAVPTSKSSDQSSSLDSAYEVFEHQRHSMPSSPGQRLSRDVIVDRIPPPGLPRARQRHASSPLSPALKSPLPLASPSQKSPLIVSKSPLPLTNSPPPWRVGSYQPSPPKPVNKASSSSSIEALQTQQKKYEQLQSEVAQQLEKTQTVYGSCHCCKQAVTSPDDATQALGHLYHSRCFTCHSCGRELKGKRFYEVADKTYCEEDYLYSGFQQSAERCAVCKHLIMDMVLQAVGKSFHPQCFRCAACKECLDGIPFALDHSGKVYCVRDYHQMFAPKCGACKKAIMPVSDTDETVRVVAMNRDYHIDCYVCEGCGTQLTDEASKRCYPLGDHLLCQKCHTHWSRTGGTKHPITDL